MRQAVIRRLNLLQQNRQQDHADKQREKNDARSQEHQLIARRERRAVRQQQRNGEHTRKGNRPAHAGERRHQQLARRVLAKRQRFFLQKTQAKALHDPQPQETHANQRPVDQNDIHEQHPGLDVRIFFGGGKRRLHNAGQLQTEHQEHHAVKHKLQHRPDAVGAQTHRQRRGAHHAGAGDGHPGGYSGQNAGEADMFGNQIRGERQQEQQNYLRSGLIAAPAAQQAQRAAIQPAYRDPGEQAANRHF